MAPTVHEQLKKWKEKAHEAAELPPLVVIVSDSDAVLHRARETFLDEALPAVARALNLQAYDAADSSPTAWVMAARTAPMLARRRIILVNDADSWLAAEVPGSTAEMEALDKYARNPRNKGVIVMSARAVAGKSPVAALAREAGWFVPFDLDRRGGGLADTVSEMFRSRGVSIDEDAAAALVDVAGGSLDALQPEVDKLADFAGRGGRITRTEVDDMAQRLQGHAWWDFSRAVAHRDTTGALRILDRMYRNLIESKKKVSASGIPLMLLTFLEGEFSKMAVALGIDDPTDSETLAARLAVMKKEGAGGKKPASEAAARAALQNARRFTAEEIAAALSAIRQVDKRLKSTNISPRLLLDELVLSICERPRKTR